MKKVTGYKVVTSGDGSLESWEADINLHISKGWQPLGTAVADGPFLVQIMVMYEDDKSLDNLARKVQWLYEKVLPPRPKHDPMTMIGIGDDEGKRWDVTWMTNNPFITDEFRTVWIVCDPSSWESFSDEQAAREKSIEIPNSTVFKTWVEKA